MKKLRIPLIVLAAALLIWALSPTRSKLASHKGVSEIHFMAPGGPISSPLEDAVREFERRSAADHAKDPSKPIYRVISGQNASREPTEDPTRFLVSVAGGMPPDVIEFDRFAVSEWAARGSFAPLDAFVEKDLAAGRADAIKAQDFYEATWQEAVYRNPHTGKKGLYGIPCKMDSRALFYNKDLLRRHGFVDSKGQARPPKTWEELEVMAVKMTEQDGQKRPTRIGFVPNFGNTFLYIYGWMNGGEFMNADATKVTLNDPKIVGALEWVTKVYDSLGGAKSVYSFQSTFQGGDLDPFILGKVGMKIDGAWILDIMAQFGQHLDWAAAEPPIPASEVAKGKRTLSWVGGWCYAIPSTAKNKEGAWELIRFLSTWDSVKILNDAQKLQWQSQGRSFVPLQHPNKAFNERLASHYVYDDPGIDPKVKQALKVFNDLLAHCRYRPVSLVGQILWNNQITAMEDAIFHKKTPKEALDFGNAQVQRQLDAALNPQQGGELSWTMVVWFYILGIILVGGLAYLWDTSHNFKLKVAALFRPLGGDKLMALSKVETAKSNYFRSQWRDGWLMASPWIIGFVLLTGGPIAFSFLISFCNFDVLNPAHFVGFANYERLFSQDPLFWKSLWNTLYMVLGVPLGMVASLALALLLNQNVRGVPVWRTFFYLPSIIPAVASSILWIWILNPSSGLLNMMLASVGIQGPSWLQDESTSKLSLVLMGLWGAGGGIIIWLAGLKGISESYYEAASLDGAGAMQKFRYVTIPMLSPYIFFNLIMGLIGTFQIFTQAFVMTKGGPVNSTLFYVYHLFNAAFRFLQMGYASALAWFLFLIIFGLTLFQLRMSSRWVHYEGD